MTPRQQKLALAAVVAAYMLSFFHRFAPAGIAQAFGWRNVFFLAAGLSLLTALACWFTISEQRDEQRLSFDRTVILGGLARVLGNRATWPALLTNFGIAGSFFAFAGLWATPYLTTVQGLSRVAAASHLSLYFAGFALGCFVIGTISDRLGKRKPVLIAGAALAGTLATFFLRETGCRNVCPEH